MIEIKSLIHRYYDINKIYNNLIQKKIFSYEEQVIISGFYDYLSQSKAIDTIVKNNLTSENTQIFRDILKILKDKLQENLSLYTENFIFLNNLETKIICKTAAEKFDYKIQNQLDIIKQYREDFNDANDAFEATAFGDFNGKEKENRRSLYIIKKEEYKNQSKILKELFNQQQEIQKETSKHNGNYFQKLYELSYFLSSELAEDKTIYFDKGLIYSIYRICNKIIFESATEENYQNSFNSLTANMVLKKAKGSQNYICYLIKFLSERVQNCDSAHWIKETLVRFDINKEDIYERKKNQVERESENQIESKFKKSKYFYNKLNEIGKIEDQISSKKLPPLISKQKKT